jgi:hypothetical protein
VLVVEGEIGYVPRGTGDEGTVFGGVWEGCVCVLGVVYVCASILRVVHL